MGETKKGGFLEKRLELKRESVKEDILFFVIPGLIVFALGLVLSDLRSYGEGGIWIILWKIIVNPQTLLMLSINNIAGLIIIFSGFSIMITGQVTLRMSHVATVAIRKNHKLRTHGIYRFTRNPMYLGLCVVVLGIPIFTSSPFGFLVMLLAIPICLSRIRLEEKLLIEEFGDEYRKYMKTTKKLVPFIY